MPDNNQKNFGRTPEEIVRDINRLKIAIPEQNTSAQEAINEMEDRAYALYKKRADRAEWLGLANLLGRAMLRYGMAREGAKAGVDLSQYNLGDPFDVAGSQKAAGEALDISLRKPKLLREQLEVQRKEETGRAEEEYKGGLRGKLAELSASTAAGKDVSAIRRKEYPAGFTPEGKQVKWAGDKIVYTETGEPYAGFYYATQAERTAIPSFGTPGEVIEKPGEEFAPSKIQLEKLENETKGQRIVLKELNGAVLNANTLISALTLNNKYTVGVIRTLAPRLFREVGNLSGPEQKVWEDFGYLFTDIKKFIDRYTDPDSTIQPEQIKQLKDMVRVATLETIKARDVEINKSVDRMKFWKVPEKHTRQYIGQQLGYSSGDKQPPSTAEVHELTKFLEDVERGTISAEPEKVKRVKKLLEKVLGGASSAR